MISSKYPLPLRIYRAMVRFESALKKEVEKCSATMREPALVTLNAGGKRLRPAVLFLTALNGRYNYQRLLPAAMAVELIHMASLVHDDVLDRADLRRGKPTVCSAFGRDKAVRVGDTLFARSFELFTKYGDPSISALMADVSLKLSVGELEEMIGPKDADRERYVERIINKTAALFMAACRLGGILSDSSAEDVKRLGDYGLNMGIAFQMFDDVLDLSASSETTGKDVGLDIAQGTVSLPLVLALEDPVLKKKVRPLIEKVRTAGTSGPSAPRSGASPEQQLLEILRTSGIEALSRNVAEKYLQKARRSAAAISNKTLGEDLIKIGDFVINRYN